ncbi:hypothetical protein AOQ84DRAFT_441989 [Glonium stellatum]|uniref:Protein kinase domain-containing protein n=1 Tax=Glonium stellatum TaxID=574774 RepID=A0A8E2EU33_9PEZI|nr:hypothetical protein AOQ84DRAFT_441989 [Glonium stellatum]
MDVFQRIVTSGTIIYRFYESYASCSNEAASLARRFKWNLRVLEKIRELFKLKASQNQGRLSEPDVELLSETSNYMESLAASVNASCAKVEAQQWWSEGTKKPLWLHRRKELRALENELSEWASRFDLRLVGLPEELKAVIQPGDEHDKTESGILLASSKKIRAIQTLEEKAKRARIDILYRNEMPKGLKPISTAEQGARFPVFQYKDQFIMLESRYYEQSHLGILPYEEWRASLGAFVAAMNELDLGIVNVLKCIGFVHDNSIENRPQFRVLYRLPYSLSSTKVPSLKDLINNQPGEIGLLAMHPLEHRYRVARDVAKALLFLHTTGFLHENIRSDNVIILENAFPPQGAKFPRALGEPYLVNFEFVRSTSVSRGVIQAKWLNKVYTHPIRQIGDERYINTFDIYSLGVVLLELGLWRPIERYENQLKSCDPYQMQQELLNIAEFVSTTMGRKYWEIVIWCLSLEGDREISASSFVHEVLQKLEDISDALC